MTVLHHATELTVTEAAQRGVARLVADAEHRLASRLISTVGMAREDVAALDLEEAVDLWTEFRSGPR